MEVRRLRKENEELKAIVGALTMDLTKLKEETRCPEESYFKVSLFQQKTLN